jgi:hypothetical protein
VLEKEPWLAEVIEGTLRPTSFACPFCELKIEDPDELAVSGLSATETHMYEHRPLLGEEPDDVEPDEP